MRRGWSVRCRWELEQKGEFAFASCSTILATIPTIQFSFHSVFFQVEYILGFGAAVVIVLTIIIVLILYLILQCRDRHKRLRAAGRFGDGGSDGGGGGILGAVTGRGLGAAGGGGGGGGLLACDRSSNSSFLERSTVDFIVPGEMELTSAVRSVSNSAMKCNGGPSGSGGATDSSGNETDAAKSQPKPGEQPSSSSLDTKPLLPAGNAPCPIGGGPHFAFVNQAGEIIRPATMGGPLPAGGPPRLPQPAFTLQNGPLPNPSSVAGHQPPWQPPGFRPAAPPSYRNPPPPGSKPGSGAGAAGASPMMVDPMNGSVHPARCPCCGEANWHRMGPAVQYHIPPTSAAAGGVPSNVSFIGFLPGPAATAAGPSHLKDCPHAAAAVAGVPPTATTFSTVILPDGTEVVPLAQLTQQQQVALQQQGFLLPNPMAAASGVVTGMPPRPMSAAGGVFPQQQQQQQHQQQQQQHKQQQQAPFLRPATWGPFPPGVAPGPHQGMVMPQSLQPATSQHQQPGNSRGSLRRQVRHE